MLGTQKRSKMHVLCTQYFVNKTSVRAHFANFPVWNYRARDLKKSLIQTLASQLSSVEDDMLIWNWHFRNKTSFEQITYFKPKSRDHFMVKFYMISLVFRLSTCVNHVTCWTRYMTKILLTKVLKYSNSKR